MVEPIDDLFPGLKISTFLVTSPPTRVYNCIAWAVGENSRWWWPDVANDNDDVYWPPGIAMEETVTAFVAAFKTCGFAPSKGEEIEQGFEKIALFAVADIPTHAARQIANGRWTSKLGMQEDIEHELHALCGDIYGAVVLILKRPNN